MINDLLKEDYHTMVIIIIVKNESEVQGWERVRTLYQSKDPNPTQPKRGRTKKRNYSIGDENRVHIRLVRRHWFLSCTSDQQ